METAKSITTPSNETARDDIIDF